MLTIIKPRAEFLLNSLVKKEILQKQGKTKSAYYELAAKEKSIEKI